MCRHYILGAALGLLTSAAYAADLPERVAVPLAPIVPAFTWAGAYIGVNIGYGGGGGGESYPFTIGGGGRTITTPNSALVTSGPLGGGQVGYNFAVSNIGLPYQGGLVVGLEADYDAANIGGNARPLGVSPLGSAGAATSSVGTTMSSVGTARGRLGVSFGRLLVFGSGGFAFAEARSSTFGTVGGLGAFSQSSHTTHDGVAFGGGAEYLLTEHITAKIEYLHADFNARQIASGASATRSYLLGERPTEDIVRIGLNYKINSLDILSMPGFVQD